MIPFLALQALVFAAWATVTASIGLALALRVARRQATPPAARVGKGAARHDDPPTRFRRRVWLALSAALALCLAVTASLIARI